MRKLTLAALAVFAVGCDTLDSLKQAPDWFVTWLFLGGVVLWLRIEWESHRSTEKVTAAIGKLAADLQSEIAALATRVSEREDDLKSESTDIASKVEEHGDDLKSGIADIASKVAEHDPVSDIITPQARAAIVGSRDDTEVTPISLTCPACSQRAFQHEVRDGHVNPYWWHCTSCGYHQRVRVRDTCPQCLAPKPSYYPAAGFHSCRRCGWEEEWQFEDMVRLARIVILAQRRLAGIRNDEDEDGGSDADWLIEEIAKEEFNIPRRRVRKGVEDAL